MRRIVSISLWGSDPKYLSGAVENARQGREFYPGWEYQIHLCGYNKALHTATVSALSALGAKVIVQDVVPERSGLYVRMFPIMYESAAGFPDVVVVRDADSRPSARESSAVSEWLASPCALHTIRDHHRHTTPIMGGLWGAKPVPLHSLLRAKDPSLRGSFNQRLDFVETADASVGTPKHGYMQFSDQDWLADAVFNRISRDDIMVHDDRRFTGSQDLPLKVRPVTPMDFCGQVYSAEGVPFWKP